MAVLTTLADRLDADPTDMEPPLYSVVDPDALDTLLRSTDDVSVTFEYLDHRVDVGSDGSVTVEAGEEARSG